MNISSRLYTAMPMQQQRFGKSDKEIVDTAVNQFKEGGAQPTATVVDTLEGKDIPEKLALRILQNLQAINIIPTPQNYGVFI